MSSAVFSTILTDSKKLTHTFDDLMGTPSSHCNFGKVDLNLKEYWGSAHSSDFSSPPGNWKLSFSMDEAMAVRLRLTSQNSLNLFPNISNTLKVGNRLNEMDDILFMDKSRDCRKSIPSSETCESLLPFSRKITNLVHVEIGSGRAQIALHDKSSRITVSKLNVFRSVPLIANIQNF